MISGMAARFSWYAHQAMETAQKLCTGKLKGKSALTTDFHLGHLLGHQTLPLSVLALGSSAEGPQVPMPGSGHPQ